MQGEQCNRSKWKLMLAEVQKTQLPILAAGISKGLDEVPESRVLVSVFQVIEGRVAFFWK